MGHNERCCCAMGCLQAVSYRHIFCRRHFGMLNSRLQRAVAAHGGPGHSDAVDQARRVIGVMEGYTINRLS